MDLRIDRAALPKAEVTRTPQGFLVVDAILARDGNLTYADTNGKTWVEHRPREELVRAAESWAYTPVTNDHPKKMVNSTTFSQVTRGYVVDKPVVTEPDENGVSYLRARVLLGDRALLDQVERGMREVSIGFLARSEPAPPESGVRFIQRDLVGNHVAVVQKGRAGSDVRLLLDSESSTISAPMSTEVLFAVTDNLGAPEGMGMVRGPDGTDHEFPMWAISLMKQGMEYGKKMEEAPPADPVLDLSTPEAPEPEKDMAPEAEKKMDAAPDIKAYRQLERIAVRLGVPEEKLDAADTIESIARAILTTAAPELDTSRMDSADALIAAVETAQHLRKHNPWASTTKPAAPKTDAAIDRLMKALED